MDVFKYDYQCPVIKDDQSTGGNVFCFWDMGASWRVRGWMSSAYLHSSIRGVGEIGEKASRHPGVLVTKAIGHKRYKSSQQPGTLPKERLGYKCVILYYAVEAYVEDPSW